MFYATICVVGKMVSVNLKKSVRIPETEKNNYL